MAAKKILDGKKIARFLRELSLTGDVSQAAEKIGVSRQAVYHLKRKDDDFSTRWSEALEASKEPLVESLESEVIRRGLRGYMKGVWFKGEKVGEERVYSDPLLLEALRALKPEKWRNNHQMKELEASLKGIAGSATTLSTEEVQLALAKAMAVLGEGK